MRKLLTYLAVAGLGLSGMLITAPSASATVHEIVGQWCSGQDELAPPGISGGSNADNFAKPLFATGVLQMVPHTGPAGPGTLIMFDEDHPATKIVNTGIIVTITPPGVTPPTYLMLIEPDPDFPAFKRCPKLAAH